MKKIAIALLLAVAASAAYAACRTYTIMKDGQMIVCTECCSGGFCNVICN